jgi:transcriptional regulator with XRE-family HTH domain
MNEKIRIEKVMMHQNMTAGHFASEIGVQNSTLSHILNNRNNPSLDVLKKILSRFPEISTDWLILGQGSMFRQEIHSKELTLFDTLDENVSFSDSSTDNIAMEMLSQSKVNQNEVLKKLPTPGSEDTSKTFLTATAKTSSTGIPTPEDRPISVDMKSNGDSELRVGIAPFQQRRATKVIIYFSDATFQEFESK